MNLLNIQNPLNLLKMDLFSQFHAYIKKYRLFDQKDRLLIAVSGGVDSVVLCELCHQTGFDFIIAHCNFKLRGAESDTDETFVKSLGLKYGVEVKTISFETERYAEEKKVNIQIAARELRYNWFNQLADELSINHILSAHHANDNAETVLMNFLKGTGINGLKGISTKDGGIGGKVARPLLFAKKETILEFASANQLLWREDQSNATSKYTRNYFRNEILPSIEKIIPAIQDNLLENISRFNEVDEIYRVGLSSLTKKLIVKKGEDLFMPVLKLQKMPALSTVLYEVLSNYHFTSQQIPEVVKLIDSESGKYIISSTHRLLKNRQWMILSPLKSQTSNVILIEKQDLEIFFSNGAIKIKSTEDSSKINTDKSFAMLDASIVKFPLLLRKYKQGDYFYPLGMEKKKKLSRFFIDNKLSLDEKENSWVIESDKKIIWIVGQRIDNRFKITHKTKSVISFQLISSK